MQYRVRVGDAADTNFLRTHDTHVRTIQLKDLLDRGHVLIAEVDGHRCGWMRWSLFWDEIPFMNMLFVLDGHRGKGVGSGVVATWETNMATAGFASVLTSSLATEHAQHFFRRRGYLDCGSLLLPGEATEIIFRKELTASPR